MNHCKKYLYLIDDLIEGELDAQIAAQVSQHIGICPDCAGEFALAEQEKQMYAHFLFDAEPSGNLRANFFARLETENQTEQPAQISEAAANWKERVFGFLNFSPALAGAALIVVFGLIFGLTKLVSNEKTGSDAVAADIQTTDFPPTPNDSQLFAPNKAKDSVQKSETAKIVKITKQIGDKRLSEKTKLPKTEKSFAAQTNKNINKPKNERNSNVPSNEFAAQTAQISEEEKQRRALLAALEVEAARQIEKVELLLRSFRNVRSADEGEVFDVAYERQQARKLLEKNVRLRRDAENFGTIYAEELLGKVEPLLLDIANLEKNAAPERVRDIKERVSSQNIIASLQIY